MQQNTILLVLSVMLLLTVAPTLVSSDSREELAPRVLVTVLVRNQAHTLPYFLHCVERLDYPKDRIALW